MDLKRRRKLSVTLGTSKATTFKGSSQDIPLHIKKNKSINQSPQMEKNGLIQILIGRLLFADLTHCFKLIISVLKKVRFDLLS